MLASLAVAVLLEGFLSEQKQLSLSLRSLFVIAGSIEIKKVQNLTRSYNCQPIVLDMGAFGGKKFPVPSTRISIVGPKTNISAFQH